MEQESELIVDDKPAVADVVREGLSQPGYRIAGIASTGEDAIAKTAGANPDPVLMDIGMRGGIDGIEAAGRIGSGFGIPVICLTGLSDHGTNPNVRREKGTLLRKMGIDDEATKCYAAAELYTK